MTEQPHGPADRLGRVYTPDALAAAIVSDLARRSPNPPKLVLEPSVGGGAFLRELARAWPLATRIAIDIDPDAEGLGPPAHHTVTGDFVTISRFWDRLPVSEGGRPDLIIGNPPFGKEVGIEVTVRHVLAAIDLARVGVSFVLPLPYLCSPAFDVVFRRRKPSVVWRIVGRPWPERLREAAVFEWNMGMDYDHTYLEVLPGWSGV